MADITPEHAKRVEAKMAYIKNRANIQMPIPWWYSGAACIAALMWLTFVVVIILNTLGYTGNPSADSARITFIAVTACIFSAMASGKK